MLLIDQAKNDSERLSLTDYAMTTSVYNPLRKFCCWLCSGKLHLDLTGWTNSLFSPSRSALALQGCSMIALADKHCNNRKGLRPFHAYRKLNSVSNMILLSWEGDWILLSSLKNLIWCVGLYLSTSLISNFFWKLSWRSFSTCCSCSPLLQWCGKATRAWSSEIWLLSSLAGSSDLISFLHWPNMPLSSAFRYGN